MTVEEEGTGVLNGFDAPLAGLASEINQFEQKSKDSRTLSYLGDKKFFLRGSSGNSDNWIKRNLASEPKLREGFLTLDSRLQRLDMELERAIVRSTVTMMASTDWATLAKDDKYKTQPRMVLAANSIYTFLDRFVTIRETTPHKLTTNAMWMKIKRDYSHSFKEEEQRERARRCFDELPLDD